MDWAAKAFLKASLVWLALGVTLGVGMAVYPPWTVYRAVHEHFNLLGFVTMMIYGVAYHVIPRFTGVPLHNRVLPTVHWWLSNAGLATMAIGLALRVSSVAATPGAILVLGAGGTCAAVGAYLFVYNLWRTLNGTPPTVAAIVRPVSRATGR